MNLLLLQVATWQQSLRARPPRRRRPLAYRRVWILVAVTLCWQVPVALLVLGLMENR